MLLFLFQDLNSSHGSSSTLSSHSLNTSHQSLNHSFSQSINQSPNQSMNQSTPLNQSLNHSLNQSGNHHMGAHPGVSNTPSPGPNRHSPGAATQAHHTTTHVTPPSHIPTHENQSSGRITSPTSSSLAQGHDRLAGGQGRVTSGHQGRGKQDRMTAVQARLQPQTQTAVSDANRNWWVKCPVHFYS